MADSGVNWSALAHADYGGGTDWDEVAINDAASQTSDEIDLDNKAALEVSVKLIEDNTGAIDGVVTIYALRSDCDPDAETWQDNVAGAHIVATITPIQNDTVVDGGFLSALQFSKCKIHLANESGQQLVTTVNIRTATIPVAS